MKGNNVNDDSILEIGTSDRLCTTNRTFEFDILVNTTSGRGRLLAAPQRISQPSQWPADDSLATTPSAQRERGPRRQINGLPSNAVVVAISDVTARATDCIRRPVEELDDDQELLAHVPDAKEG